MQVNKYLSNLPNLDNPALGKQSNASTGLLGTTLASKSAVVLSINSAAPIPSPMSISYFLANLTKFANVQTLQIQDTAANIAKNLDTLQNSSKVSPAILGKITSISQKGTPQNIPLTYSQWTNTNCQNVLAKLDSGSDIFAVRDVDMSTISNQDFTNLEAEDRIKSIGAMKVAKGDLHDMLAALNANPPTSKVTTIGVVDLSYADYSDSASNYYSDVRDRAVTSIGVLDVPSQNLASVLGNTKVKTATVIDVLAKDALKVGSKPQVINFTVSDTSANLATNFSGMLSKQGKITAVNQATPAEAMNLTGAQYKAAGVLLGTFDTDYTVNLNNVRAADFTTLAADSAVLQIDVLDSGLGIGRNFDALNTSGTLDKVKSIGLGTSKDAVTISALQYEAGTDSDLFGKIQGTYTLAITNASYSQLSSLSLNSNAKIKSVGLVDVPISNLADAAHVGKVKTIQVADTASNVSLSANLSILKANFAKVTRIGNSNDPSGLTRENIVFTPTTYDAKLVDKLVGFGTAVDYTAYAAEDCQITSDSKGLRAITTPLGVKKVYSNNVNFFQFSDKNLFGTTGNKNVDTILLGGTKNWWLDTTSAATSNTQIDGVMNSLSAASSKHALTFSFLGSSADISNASPSYKDKTGFAAMGDGANGTPNQQAGVKKALDYISTLTNLTFTQVDPGEGDINFGTNDQGTASGAYAYSPNSGAQVNVMLNNHAGNAATINAVLTQGSYGWETLIHEIAHAVGLKHPGNYNAGGGGTVGPYLPTGDAGSSRFTIMSYNNPKDAQNVNVTPAGLNPDTFMVYDIAALQFLYGVNTHAQGAQNLQAVANNESASTVFQVMTRGQTLTLAGLTFTAGTDGALAAQVATAFSGITDGMTASELNTLHALGDARGGIFSDGSASGWTSSAANDDTVVFTSTTSNANVTNLGLTSTLVAPQITTINGGSGTHESATIIFQPMAPGQTLALAGITFTAGSGGASADDVALSFSGITDGTLVTDLSSTVGSFTGGPFIGWDSGVVMNGQTVIFNSTATGDVPNLEATGSHVAQVTTLSYGLASEVGIDLFQTTTFTSGWRGFESLYIPEAQTGEILDLSDVSNKNIVDLRAGAFSSINVLPPSAKTDLPYSLRAFQTYFGYNNVAMAYGSEINTVKGGGGADTYYVSDKNVSIMDAGGINRVYLNGQASDWNRVPALDSDLPAAVVTYTHIGTDQAVELVGSEGGSFQVSFYDSTKQSLTHGPLDLLA
jgi:hypothetical protein